MDTYNQILKKEKNKHRSVRGVYQIDFGISIDDFFKEKLPNEDLIEWGVDDANYKIDDSKVTGMCATKSGNSYIFLRPKNEIELCCSLLHEMGHVDDFERGVFLRPANIPHINVIGAEEHANLYALGRIKTLKIDKTAAKAIMFKQVLYVLGCTLNTNTRGQVYIDSARKIFSTPFFQDCVSFIGRLRGDNADVNEIIQSIKNLYKSAEITSDEVAKCLGQFLESGKAKYQEY